MSANPGILFQALLKIKKEHYAEAMAKCYPEAHRDQVTTICSNFYDAIIQLFPNEESLGLAFKLENPPAHTLTEEEQQLARTILVEVFELPILAEEKLTPIAVVQYLKDVGCEKTKYNSLQEELFIHIFRLQKEVLGNGLQNEGLTLSEWWITRKEVRTLEKLIKVVRDAHKSAQASENPQSSSAPGEGETKGSRRESSESKDDLTYDWRDRTEKIRLRIIRTLFYTTLRNEIYRMTDAQEAETAEGNPQNERVDRLEDIMVDIVKTPDTGITLAELKKNEAASEPQATRKTPKKDPLDEFERIMLSIIITLAGGVVVPLIIGLVQALDSRKSEHITSGNFLLCKRREPKAEVVTPDPASPFNYSLH